MLLYSEWHCFQQILHMLIAALFHIILIFQLIQFWKLKVLLMAQPVQTDFPREEMLLIQIPRSSEIPKMVIWSTSI